MAQQAGRNLIASFVGAVQTENGAAVAQFLRLTNNDAVVAKLHRIVDVNMVSVVFVFFSLPVPFNCATLKSGMFQTIASQWGAVWSNHMDVLRSLGQGECGFCCSVSLMLIRLHQRGL
jgi:hypothetical protein